MAWEEVVSFIEIAKQHRLQDNSGGVMVSFRFVGSKIQRGLFKIDDAIRINVKTCKMVQVIIKLSVK